jgi:hypothetical protein
MNRLDGETGCEPALAPSLNCAMLSVVKLREFHVARNGVNVNTRIGFIFIWLTDRRCLQLRSEGLRRFEWNRLKLINFI